MTRRKKPTSTARTSFTQEFRETAVKLVQTGNKSTAEIARELDLPAWKLYAWVDSAEKKRLTSKGGNANAADEMKKLQKRNKELEQEVEILKKAAAYFAKNLP